MRYAPRSEHGQAVAHDDEAQARRAGPARSGSARDSGARRVVGVAASELRSATSTDGETGVASAYQTAQDSATGLRFVVVGGGLAVPRCGRVPHF